MAAGPHFEATFKSTAAQSFQTSLEDVKTNQNMRLKTSTCCRRRHILAPWMFVALLSAPKVVWGILLSRKWLLLSQGKAASLILKQVKGAPWWRKCKTPRELRHSLGVSEREAKWNETIQISFGATLFFFFFFKSDLSSPVDEIVTIETALRSPVDGMVEGLLHKFPREVLRQPWTIGVGGEGVTFWWTVPLGSDLWLQWHT